MKSTVSKVLVVGGGIGGMATAIRLRESGIAVDLVDVDPQWRVYGAGITITGPTLRAYRRLGLLDAIKAEGAITNGSRIFRFDGHLLRDLDEPALEEGLPATGGIMRPVLHKIMQKRVQELATVVRLGVTVESLDEDESGVDVTFSNAVKSRYDLVIGADGIFSRVRQLAFPHMRPTVFTGQGCWRITSSRPPGFDRGEFYLGHQNPAGITACGPDSVYLWVLTEDREHRRIPEDQMHARLRAHIADFGGNVAWMRDQMTRNTWINYRPLEAALQPRPWHSRRIALVGDACHATTPHLASGAGMAVEDAVVLVDELADAARPVVQSLAAYEQRRYERCRHVVESSVAVGALQLQGGSAEQIGAMIGGALHRLAEPF
jgi:2-polyprenyl-6-methoxyphenol hydroxylase-like FAD-dependent oxidoreductase